MPDQTGASGEDRERGGTRLTSSAASHQTRINAVILASGGLDSTVVTAVAKHDGCVLHLLTLSYGQRHQVELEGAKRMAQVMGAASHLVLPLDLRAIGASAL